MLRSKSRVLALVPAAVLALAAAGCGSSDSSGGTGAPTPGGVTLIQSGKVLTCTGLPYEPFQFEKDGKVVGFDVDLVDLVAKKLNATQEVIDTPFEGIQSGVDLNSGKCDLAAAGMTIDDTRKENFDFSDPYFDATQVLVGKKGAGLTGLDKLQGKKLGVQNGTTGAKYAKEKAPDVEQVVFEDLGLLLSGLETGAVDAAINDNGVVYDWVNKHADYEVGTEFATGEQYGIGVKKGNTALLKVINETIAETRASGQYDTIYEKWFGKKPESK